MSQNLYPKKYVKTNLIKEKIMGKYNIKWNSTRNIEIYFKSRKNSHRKIEHWTCKYEMVDDEFENEGKLYNCMHVWLWLNCNSAHFSRRVQIIWIYIEFLTTFVSSKPATQTDSYHVRFQQLCYFVKESRTPITSILNSKSEKSVLRSTFKFKELNQRYFFSLITHYKNKCYKVTKQENECVLGVF